MDKKKALKLFKEALNEIPKLKSLGWDNQEFKLWRDKILDTLEASFGHKSTEFDRFASAWSHVKGYASQQKEYLDELEMRETALKSIIQKHKLLGIETKPAVVSGLLTKDTTEFPLQLFDMLQLHPKVIEASRRLFKDGHYSQAIFEAFKAVNNLVKKKSGLSATELRGMKDRQLMAKVFDEKAPLIKLNELSTDTDISEQEGFKFLFMGANAGIRNPKAHDEVIQKDPYKTLEHLAFASLLIKKIAFWKAG